MGSYVSHYSLLHHGPLIVNSISESKGIAAAHAKTGVRGLVLVARSSAGIERVKEAILAEHPSVNVLAVAADVSDEKAVEFLFEKVKQHFGTADTLVNNAGVVTTYALLLLAHEREC